MPGNQNVVPEMVSNSRLPRRQIKRPSVAELVKKYSEFLPSQGVEELAKTALSPHLDTAESEQDSAAPWPKPLAGRNRLRRPVERRTSASDFESSYAANAASRYLTHSRRTTRRVSQSSRIPGPVTSSNYTSRQHSPEKPVLSFDSDVATKTGVAKGFVPGVLGRGVTPKLSRNLGKDKSQLRSVSTVSKTIAARRGAPPGNRVSNIAKHFERINKDNERANRRYAVIRGRRARPVASSRAKVEVLDSVKDAIQDESESSDSSSEADDEGGDDEDTNKLPDKVSPEASGTLPTHSAGEEPKDPTPVRSSEPNAAPSSIGSPGITSESPLSSRRDTLTSAPPSPYLLSTADTKAPAPTPLYDFDLGPPGQERNSLLRALSGFWPQNIPHRNRADDEADDPRYDPEHIFRDSSMVVRTDEPTSIIALALKSVV